MSKRIALFCALIGVLAFVATPAYAEVQNIKISGDIQALGVYRNNYDLEDGIIIRGDDNLWTTNSEDQDSLFTSIVRLQVDADLTDNVAATLRLANAREWDMVAGATEDIVLDLANITLKEMLYSPLTLVIGRQELQFGNGLIVGMGRFQDSNAVKYDDLLPFHGYDAVRAILDYDPWTLDLVAVKVNETDNLARGATRVGRDADQDLYGVNLGYMFDRFDAEMEGYVFTKRDETWGGVVDSVNAAGNVVAGTDISRRTYEENEVYTIGLRGSLIPLENLTLAAEVAGQFGEITDNNWTAGDTANTALGKTRDREALAVNVAGVYDFADVRFAPSVGLEYLYLSGEEAAQDGDFEDWDPMYRGKMMGTIRDMLENAVLGGTAYNTNDNLDTSGWTNQHTIKARGSLDLGELVDGLSLDMAYLHYWFAEEPLPGADDEIGDEVNLKLTYDYTEDVQFALDGAMFIPGDYYDRVALGTARKGRRAAGATGRAANDTATSIVGSCKVAF